MTLAVVTCYKVAVATVLSLTVGRYIARAACNKYSTTIRGGHYEYESRSR